MRSAIDWMCLNSTASLDCLIRSSMALLLKGRPDNLDCLQNREKFVVNDFRWSSEFESSDCWIAIRMIQWYYQKLRCASGSSLAAALHFCAPLPVPEAISRPEEAPIGNWLRKIETIRETPTVYYWKWFMSQEKWFMSHFRLCSVHWAAQRAFCKESDANFKISREWQTPAN